MAQGFEIGAVVDVMRYARALAGGDAIVAAAGDADLVVEPPSSGEIRLSRQSPLLPITEPGFYQVHRATPASAQVVLAANINPLEANLEILDVTRFVEEIRASAEPQPGASGNHPATGHRVRAATATVVCDSIPGADIDADRGVFRQLDCSQLVRQ